MTKPLVSIVMPVYNTEKYVCQAIDSVLAQTFEDFELLIIDDGSTDNSVDLCAGYADPRIRVLSQANRGLAGARNTGIRIARGKYIAFLDSDDLWEPKKLQSHIVHLNGNPDVGVSYAASRMIDETGKLLRIVQRPKLKNVTPKDVFMRNPIGNGSAPVIRQTTLDDIAFMNTKRGEFDYFDETLRQSEDIECWTRIALKTEWRFEGIRGAFTRYRINEGGLSSNVIRQFETWSRVRDSVRKQNPRFADLWSRNAEAFQLRYLARRCVKKGDGAMAFTLMIDAMRLCPRIMYQEPVKSLTTLLAAVTLRSFPHSLRCAVSALPAATVAHD